MQRIVSVVLTLALAMSFLVARGAPVARTQQEPGAVQPALGVVCSFLRQGALRDAGTVHVFLRNDSDSPVHPDKILLNGRVVSMGAPGVVWYQMIPDVIPAKGIGDLAIKLTARPKENLRVSVVARGQTVATRVRLEPQRIAFTYVAFSDDLRTVYLYVQNRGIADLRIKDVELPGVAIKSVTSLSGQDPQRVAIIAKLEEPLAAGAYLPCKLVTDHGDVIMAMTRVYSHFPIQAFGQDNREALAFDPENVEMPFSPLIGDLIKTRKAPAFKAYHLVDDPVCADDGHFPGYTAAEVARLGILSRAADARHPSIIYMCQYMMPDNYFVYGELTDIASINPFVWAMHHGDPRINMGYIELARLASEPRPLFTISDAAPHPNDPAGRLPTKDEERLTVYYQIAAGSKGIWYYIRSEYSKDPVLEAEIGRINQELRTLRPFLRIGDPMDMVKCSLPTVTASTILAGDKGIVLILVNNVHESRWGEEAKASPFSITPQEHVFVEVHIPKGLKVSRVLRVSGKEKKPYPFFRKGDTVRILVDVLDVTEQFLLLP